LIAVEALENPMARERRKTGEKPFPALRG